MLRFYLSLQLHGTAVFTLVRYELGSEITTQQVFHGLCCTLLDRKGLYSHLVIVGWALPTISPIHRQDRVYQCRELAQARTQAAMGVVERCGCDGGLGKERAIECSGWRA